MSESPAEITLLLGKSQAGDRRAQGELFRLVESELRQIADAYLRNERADHSWQATLLIDDAFLKLLVRSDGVWPTRRHFYVAAAHVMRRLLVDHARRHRAEKRGGGRWRRTSLDPDELGQTGSSWDVLALDEALTRLAALAPRQAEVIALHHFGGRTMAETADALGIAPTTAKDDWRVAKAWLRRELERSDGSE